MTRVLYFADPNMILLADIPVPAARLVADINAGQLPGELSGYNLPAKEMRAFQSGEMVVILGKQTSHADDTIIMGNLPGLSERESQVLQALAEGLTQKMIANRFGVKTRTVREYLQVLRKKIGAKTNEQLVARGVLLGLCKPHHPQL